MGEESRKSVEPWVEIVEQPGTMGLRFRRKVYGWTGDIIQGANSTSDKKTFPTVKIHGYTGQFVIVVSCVSADEPYTPHPHNLVGIDCKTGVSTTRVSNTNTVSYPHLNIQYARKKDVESRLKLRKEINVDPFQTGFKFERSNIDLNVVRLCFQVFLANEHRKISRIVPPVVSQPICDERYRKKNNPHFLNKHLFQQVQDQSELCDVTIQVGTWTRKYHWCVLTAIPFFQRLYASKMKEQQSGIISFSIGTPYSVQTSLDFLYGKEPDVAIES